MKKVLMVLLVLMLIAAVGIGYLVFTAPEQLSYETKVVVNKPVEQTYAIFSDESKMKDWLVGLEKIENISGEKLEVGSKWKLTFDEDGRKVEMIETVTKVEPNKLFEFDLDTDFFKGTTTVLFTEVDGKTEITSTNLVIPASKVWGAVMNMMSGGMREQSESYYTKLKELCEAS